MLESRQDTNKLSGGREITGLHLGLNPENEDTLSVTISYHAFSMLSKIKMKRLLILGRL